MWWRAQVHDGAAWKYAPGRLLQGAHRDDTRCVGERSVWVEDDNRCGGQETGGRDAYLGQRR
jgi:hypothetical protein